jgi:ubiquinone biosynthesis monooxygenase Coq7
MLAAAAEERDHLAWCTARIDELGGRGSLLDPLWFAGSAATGALIGLAGDAASLGFIEETEIQVESHLRDHMSRLPENDARSRAILEQMATDERNHGSAARAAGGETVPAMTARLMTIGGEVLRTLALRI